MKRKTFLKEYFSRFALTLLFLCLIVYTVYHALGNSSGSLITTPARQITDTRLLGGTGYLFREETLLTVPQAGLVNSLAGSGSKVGRNVPMAEVWVLPDASDLAKRQKELDAVNRTIAVLEKSLPSAGTSLSEAEPCREEAMDLLTEIRKMIASGDWSETADAEDRMLAALNRYQALTDGQAEQNIRAALEEAKAARAGMLTGTCFTVLDETSSCYYYGLSTVDGYERIFNGNALDALTVESFSALAASEPSEPEGFVVGKKSSTSLWHLAVGFDDGAGSLFEAGSSYHVGFPENGGLTLTMVCEKILLGEDGKTVAVFSSEDSPVGFSWLRSQDVEIEVGSERGYYVPEQAAVTVDGVEGVYVLEGSVVRFRRIRVLYRGDGYLIAGREDNGGAGTPYLTLNDLMITSGKNLYDGKVYQ